MRLPLPRPFWLLLTVALLGVAGGGFHYWSAYRSARQLEADVEALGGGISIEYRGPGWLIEGAKLRGWEDYIEWLRSDVDTVRVDQKTVDDAWVRRLRPHRNITSLHLSETAITDAGLETVKSLPALVLLNLNDTGITDAGVKHLAGATALQRLMLERTRVTDSGLYPARQKMTHGFAFCEFDGIWDDAVRVDLR